MICSRSNPPRQRESRTESLARTITLSFADAASDSARLSPLLGCGDKSPQSK